MSYPLRGDAEPLHPDQYGRPGRVRDPHPFESDIEIEGGVVTDEEADAMWAQEQELRKEEPLHRHHGCGHDCTSMACVVFCGLKDGQCHACQVAGWSRRR